MPTKSDEFQQFLDQNQYSNNSILRYEKIFGRGFVSTGGLETTEVRHQLRSKVFLLGLILIPCFFHIFLYEITSLTQKPTASQALKAFMCYNHARNGEIMRVFCSKRKYLS